MIFKTKRVYNLEDVFSKLYYTDTNSKKKKGFFFNEEINLASLKLSTFKEKGIACVSCNRVGSHFRLQKRISESKFYLSLWTEDDLEMTKDHIYPKSRGGQDILDNMQPMCSECNTKKGNTLDITYLN